VDLIIHKVAWHQMNNILTVTLACFVLIYLMGNRNEARDHVLRYSVFFGEFIDGRGVATVFSDTRSSSVSLLMVGATHKRGSLTFLDRATQETVEGSQLGALLWVMVGA
jgi:hypothetical protein